MFIRVFIGILTYAGKETFLFYLCKNHGFGTPAKNVWSFLELNTHELTFCETFVDELKDILSLFKMSGLA